MKNFSFYLFLFLAAPSLAQIPNASFENWTGGDPDGWISANSQPDFVIIEQSSTAHDGNSSVKYLIEDVAGFPVCAPFASGSQASAGQFPVTSRPDAIHGWIITNFVSNDELHITVAAKNNGADLGAGNLVITANNASWQEFSVSMAYNDGTTIPDSMAMTFRYEGEFSPNGYHIGTYVIFDDLSFGGATATSNPSNTNDFAFHLFPNPSNCRFNLQLSGIDENSALLEIYSITGEKIYAETLQPESGRYSGETILNSAPGMYFVKVTADGRERIEKVIIY